MRILLLTPYYFPKTQSCAHHMHDLAVAFRDQGHEVTILAPEDTLAERLTIDTENGLTVVRVKAGPFRGVARPVRAFNEWRLSGIAWRRAGTWLRGRPCDLIVNYSPTIFFGPLVARLKRLWRCPAYLVLRDIFPKWSVDAGVMRAGSVAHRIFRHYERRLYDAADVIGVQSARNLDYFVDEGLADRYELEVLYNWAPSSGQPVAETRLRANLGLADKLVVLYGGNLGVVQDLDGLLDLAGRLSDRPDIFFLLVGDGSEADRLADEARQRRLDNIRFHPALDRASYLGVVAESDVGLIRLRRSLQTHNFPGKMLDYMYFAKPILASVNPGNDLQQMLEEHEAGLVSWSGDDEAFLEQLLRLADDPPLRARLGGNGRRLLERVFSTGSATRRILAHVPGQQAIGDEQGDHLLEELHHAHPDRVGHQVESDARGQQHVDHGGSGQMQ